MLYSNHLFAVYIFFKLDKLTKNKQLCLKGSFMFSFASWYIFFVFGIGTSLMGMDVAKIMSNDETSGAIVLDALPVTPEIAKREIINTISHTLHHQHITMGEPIPHASGIYPVSGMPGHFVVDIAAKQNKEMSLVLNGNQLQCASVHKNNKPVKHVPAIHQTPWVSLAYADTFNHHIETSLVTNGTITHNVRISTPVNINTITIPCCGNNNDCPNCTGKSGGLASHTYSQNGAFACGFNAEGHVVLYQQIRYIAYAQKIIGLRRLCTPTLPFPPVNCPHNIAIDDNGSFACLLQGTNGNPFVFATNRSLVYNLPFTLQYTEQGNATKTLVTALFVFITVNWKEGIKADGRTLNPRERIAIKEGGQLAQSLKPFIDFPVNRRTSSAKKRKYAEAETGTEITIKSKRQKKDNLGNEQ
jgi:hypothetical protein